MNKAGKYTIRSMGDEEDIKGRGLQFQFINGGMPAPVDSFTELKLADSNSQLESESSNDDSKDEKRQQWDNQFDFLMSCIAMSVGLGNIWRFPFIAYNNGGGAFIIPYLIVLFFIGKPMYFLEMSMGQFCSKGQVKVWKMVPFFKGVGYGAAFGSACLVSFYCSLMALTIFYFIQSFTASLPWSTCNPAWEISHNITCRNNSVIGSNKSIPELYFKLDVLQEKSQIDDGIGTPDWRLTLCLLASWAVILITLIKGVQSAGKVAYFTALFPYVVLFIFLIRGVTLEGAMDGIWYFIKPDWSKLFGGKIWVEAVTQCFFSLSTGFGPIITYSSYNRFNHNVYRDAFIVSLMDTFTSLLAGVTIFAILGSLAAQSNVPIDKVVGGGPALAFVSYPDAISKFQFLPQLFSVLFFLMLFTLGVGSATSLANGLITLIHDEFKQIKKIWITIFVCSMGFLSGLVYVTPGGLWILDLVNYFGAGFIIYVIATLELIGMVWFYGLNNIVRDIEFMLERKVSYYWKTCWALTPLVLVGVLSYSLATDDAITYEKKPYPQIAIVFGWMLVGIAVMILPIAALHSILNQKATGFMEKLKASLKPSLEWGPADESIRMRWRQHQSLN